MENANIVTNWDQIRAASPPAKDVDRKEKRERRASKLFRRALDWVTKENPSEDYETRCKFANVISKAGFCMPKINGRERHAAIWERRIMHKRAEEALDKLPNPRRSRYSSGYGYVVIGK